MALSKSIIAFIFLTISLLLQVVVHGDEMTMMSSGRSLVQKIAMDKTRDVRRAKPSRFSSASTHLSTQSGSDFNKLRRDRVRRLSLVDRLCDNNPDSEMPCVQSDDEEDEYHPCATKSKRIKLPRKFFDDCQKVDHSSVPRKLRSAIRKRRRESVSPHFPEVRKLNHSANGIERVKRDVIKNSKPKQREKSEGSPGLASVMPISKDEEEVAQTLYALADMFPDSDKTETAKSTVPEVEKDLQTPFTTTAPETAQHSSYTVGSADETERNQYSNRRTEFDMHKYKQYPTESLNCIPKSNCTKVPMFSKTSSANENRSSNSSFPSHSQLSREIGLKRPIYNLNLATEINREIAVESVATSKGQNEIRLSTRENRNNEGSALRPGSSSTSVHTAKTLGSPVKLSASKLPTWLGISTSTAKACSSRKVAIAEKVGEVKSNLNQISFDIETIHQMVSGLDATDTGLWYLCQAAGGIKDGTNSKPSQKLFTVEQLALYNGTDAALPILLAILGSVFDVTKGRSHYGLGGGYNHFAGRKLVLK